MVEVEASLYGSGQEFHALLLADGQLLLVPQAAVESRKVADGPTPVSLDDMPGHLEELFGADKIVTHTEDPMVMAIVMDRPVTDRKERYRRLVSLRQAGRYLASVQGKFVNYARKMRVPAETLQFPLVALIFESDAEFNVYAAAATGDQGLAAANIAGFYSILTNQLVLRMRECTTFEVPLHEAIHQCVYNRQMLKRLAPIPVWFNEGIATGFEGDGMQIRTGPTNISPRYSRLALAARRVDWHEIVANDRAFQGNVLVGEAYGHAWALHWTLVTRHKNAYSAYVKMLAGKEPLALDQTKQRVDEFERTTEMPIEDMQREFYDVINRLQKRSRSQTVPALLGPFDAGQFADTVLRPGVWPETLALPANSFEPVNSWGNSQQRDLAGESARQSRFPVTWLGAPGAGASVRAGRADVPSAHRLTSSARVDLSLPVGRRWQRTIDRSNTEAMKSHP